MRPVLIGLCLGFGALALWLWGMGGAQDLARWAATGQRGVQEAMAGLLRRLKAGDMGALAALWGMCFAYGFFHAVGPGHGKLMIGGYGVARRVALLKLSALAVASSMAQAAMAVVVIYAGVFLFELTRTQIVAFGEDVLGQLSLGLIILLGLWLVWRGLRRLIRQERMAQAHPPSDHAHQGTGNTCSECGHKHGPDLQEAAAVHTWRGALALIAAIAIRPCTGALFLLILTWRMGIDWAGIIGVFFMGAGTATVSLVVALAAVTFREGLFQEMQRSPATLRAVPLIEIAAGAVIVLITFQMLGPL